MKKEETFENLIKQFEPRFDLRMAFSDFLTMSMCSVTLNPLTGKSHYEELYMETVAKYAESDLRHLFPKMFATLVAEMDKRLGGGACGDVLGEFYEKNIARKGTQQYFTPWHVCTFMAQSAAAEARSASGEKALRVLEPSCGSGRMLLAMRSVTRPSDEFYGVDIDHVCVQMACLNLFLCGMFRSEVMCGNFLLPDDFRVSYRLSFLPLGIFRIEKKEDSRLWRMLTSERARKEGPSPPSGSTDPSKFSGGNEQLKFF